MIYTELDPRPPIRVVGMDLSLRSAGFSDGCASFVEQPPTTDVIERRLDDIVERAVGFTCGTFGWAQTASLVVIEDSAFSRKGPGHEELAALRLMVRTALWKLGVPFTTLAPSSLKLWATGDGRAEKSMVVDAMNRRFGLSVNHVKLKDGRTDMADAYALAAYGYEKTGHPLIESEGV